MERKRPSYVGFATHSGRRQTEQRRNECKERWSGTAAADGVEKGSSLSQSCVWAQRFVVS